MTRDLRKYTQQTNVQLVIGGILILLIVGVGMIYLLYGTSAAVTGLLCILAGLAPLLLIWLFLTALGWIAKMRDSDDY